MSDGEVIECRPTKWFYLRAIAMVTMFAVFCVLFLKDWKYGWPKKNEVYYTFQAFKEAELAFQEHEEEERSGEEWAVFVEGQTVGFPEGEGILPEALKPPVAWPEVLRDYEGYKRAYEEEGNKAIPPLWASYTDERGWSSGTPEKSYGEGKIREQLYFGIGSGFLMMVGGYFLVRTSRRSMKVDGEAYYAPNGERIPFSSIGRIDKRKWETKGLAYLYHQSGESGGGELKKAKVDGMVYGQFRTEDGAPAERLFRRILDHFTGELVELEDDEEEEENVRDDEASDERKSGVAGQEDAAQSPTTKEKGE